MADDPKNQPTNDSPIKDITRRDFAVLVVGAGLAATIPAAAAADLELIETDVEIKTPDGTCDAAFIRPKSGSRGVSLPMGIQSLCPILSIGYPKPLSPMPPPSILRIPTTWRSSCR